MLHLVKITKGVAVFLRHGRRGVLQIAVNIS